MYPLCARCVNVSAWSTGLLKGRPARSDVLSSILVRLNREMPSEWLRTLLRARWVLYLVCEHGCLSVNHTLCGREEVVQADRCVYG